MKKLLALLMVVVLCVSLCACGSKDSGSETTAPTEEPTMSKEDMLAQAQDVTLGEILSEIESNEIRAEELYEDKIVKIENFKVEEIKSYNDFAQLNWTYWGSANSVITVHAKISKSEAASLSTGDLVTVVGEFDITSSVYADINNAFIVNE